MVFCGERYTQHDVMNSFKKQQKAPISNSEAIEVLSHEDFAKEEGQHEFNSHPVLVLGGAPEAIEPVQSSSNEDQANSKSPKSHPD